jgi:hypothetical protein
MGCVGLHKKTNNLVNKDFVYIERLSVETDMNEVFEITCAPEIREILPEVFEYLDLRLVLLA